MTDLLEYSIIDSSGRVMGAGKTMHYDLKLEPGQTIIQSEAPLNTYRSGDAWIAIPPQPSPNHVFDWPSHGWIDPRTITDLRDAKWLEIKNARLRYSSAGLVVEGLGKYDTDPEAVQNITGYYAALGDFPVDWTIEWTLFDNSVTTLTKEQFRTVAIAVLALVERAHEIGRELRVRIYAANENELPLIKWPE